MSTQRQKGFTLVETMIALAIAGILAVGITVVITQGESLSNMFLARSDAESTSLRVLQRLYRFYMTKKPGVIATLAQFNSSVWEEHDCRFNPAQTNGCLATPPAPESQFSFALVKVRPMSSNYQNCNGKDCNGIILARGMRLTSSWVNRYGHCGCSPTLAKGETVTLVTRCIRAPNGPLGSADFRGQAECTKCRPGYRPVIMEYRVNPDTKEDYGGWRYYPDNRPLTAQGREVPVGEKRAVGMELCANYFGSVGSGRVSFRVNAFYLQQARTASRLEYVVRKRSQDLDLPEITLTNGSVRFFPGDKGE